MVLFGIKLRQKDGVENAGSTYRLPTTQNSTNYHDKSYIPTFEPDITKVVSFGHNKTQFMRLKTQQLILQNYEKVKQAMLAGTSADKAIYTCRLSEASMYKN